MPDKRPDQQAADNAQAIADDQTAAIDTAANAAQDSAPRAGIAKARQAELDRQQDVVDAVAKANDKDLPKLGGDLLEPGLGR